MTKVSLKGEKFRDLLGPSGMWGKILQFFPSPPSYIHGFPTLPKQLQAFQRKLHIPQVNSP